MGDPDTRNDALGSAFETVRTRDPVAMRQALARVEGKLFGTSAEVIRFSRYLLLERVGQGGIGVVHAAYDPELDRRVAIKFLRRDGGRADDEARRRLVREAQAMAQVTHPNVAAVYDVGEYDVSELSGGDVTARGDRGVFIVMEFLKGQNLRQWLTDSARSWRKVLEVFLAAGQGLAAAHAAGMVHRDFKPANVILTPDGRVVVLDFGLARAASTQDESGRELSPDASVTRALTASRLDDALTEAGSVLGTPSYMAPEQHAGVGADQRSDQYSYCAALYRALYGELPFAAATEEDLLAAKRRGLPSAAPRATRVPSRLFHVLRRGLDPEPARRYPSMPVLLTDLGRASAGRIRWALAVVAGVVIIGGALAWSQAPDERCTGAPAMLHGVWDDDVRTRVETALLATGAPYAPGVLAHVKQQLDGYAADWVAIHTQSCEATTVRGEQSAAAMDLTMACLRRARASLGAATSVLAVADGSVMQKAHRIVDGLDPLERCTDIAALAADVEPPGEAEAEAVYAIRERLAEAAALREAGRYEDARAAAERAQTEAENVEYGPIDTEIAITRARVMLALEQYDDAAGAFRAAIHLGSRFGQWKEVGTAASLLMGLLGGTQAKPKEAMALRELAWGLAERSGDAEAIAVFHDRLGAVLAAQGKFPEAEAEYRIALDLRERTLGPDHLSVASSRNQVAVMLGRQGKYAEAELELRQAVELRERVLGPQHPLVPKARGNLASNLMMQGKYDESLEQHRLTLEALEYVYGPDSETVLTVRENTGHVLDNLDRYEEAEKIYREVLEARKRTMEPGHPDIAMTHLSLAVSYSARRDFDKALPEARQAATLMEQALGPEHPYVGVAYEQLADVLRELGEHEEALRHAERAWAIHDRGEVSPRFQAASAFTLGRLKWNVGTDRKQARDLVERSLRLYEKIGEPYTEEIETVRRWLADKP